MYNLVQEFKKRGTVALQVKIKSIGNYFPKNIVTSEALEKQFKLSLGEIARKNGVISRHWSDKETCIDIGKNALDNALKKANLKIKDIDCIVWAAGTAAQLIPCTASLVAQKYGVESAGIPCFDINATCLSSLFAVETLSYLIEAGKYRRVAIVCGEQPSLALDKKNLITTTLFGDAGCAIILEKGDNTETSRIIDSKFETFAEFSQLTRLKGGASILPGYQFNKENKSEYFFQMDGEKIYKYAAKNMPIFLKNLLLRNNLSLDDIKMVVPHQASLLSLKLMQKKLGIPEGKLFINIKKLGNTVAASIPLALMEAIEKGLVERGDKVLLLGTSAGLTLGAMIIEY